MTPQRDDLATITAKTLEYYNECAAEFWAATRDHDVKQNIAALLRHIRAAPPFRILDFGCGPGRDLAAFRALGHEPIGLEGSPTLAAMAREHSGCEVWEQDFLGLKLPAARFDGIFANASLFHVPGQELVRVLSELRAALKPEGVLFTSNPRGTNEEGWNRGRYGVYHDLESWRAFLEAAGFTELEHYYRPAGLPLEQQPWLASVWRKRDPTDRSVIATAEQTLTYLPDGPRRPTRAALEEFCAAARAANPALALEDHCEVRWIGLDAATTLQIFDLIRTGDKTGTFTLPWIVERTGQPEPAVGACIVLIDMDGRPTLLIRLTHVYQRVFGQVTAADTAVDGSPVRDPAAWVPLHTQYWNSLLQPFGRAVTDDMPFWVEQFELLFDAG